MFHSHSLHLQAEAVLKRVDLGPGATFSRWRPECAIGHLASESGYVPLDPKMVSSPNAGEDVVMKVYGLTQAEVNRIMSINDASGAGRAEKLVEALRQFCPVCKPLQIARPRRVIDLVQEEA